MFMPVLLPLALNLLAVPGPSPAAVRPPAPAVKVWLSSKGDFVYGEKAKAYVQSAEDGYVVVLQVEPQGRFRVLFPADPTQDQFVKGGKKYEIRGRGDRGAFIAADSGQGVVFAAFSKSRFAVEKFTQNGHWDYRALAGEVEDGDIEARLMDVVHEMQPTEHYAFDAANYSVTDNRYASHENGSGGYGGPRIGVGLSIGVPLYGGGYGYGYSPFFRPYYGGSFYSPFARYGPSTSRYSWGGIRSWGR